MPSSRSPSTPQPLSHDATVIARARQVLPRNAFDYYAGSAGDERTYRANLRAFANILFRPRCLVPVAHVDTSANLPAVGRLSCPILIAPMAMQKMAHPQGELAVARAVARLGLGLVLSMFSNAALEDVAVPDPLRLFHVYLFKDRADTLHLMRRARAAGYRAIVLTVDAPRFGRRDRDRQNTFHLPSHLSLGNFDPATAGAAISSVISSAVSSAAPNRSAVEQLATFLESDLSLDALRWLVRNAGLPVWVKGILRADDAKRAVDAGAAAIIVSNHGARQLEGTIPSIQALPEVVAAVRNRVPVLMDSGVRTGEDVVRACALGAHAVLVGRPVLWALAKNGETAVYDFLSEMMQNVDLTMALCGATATKNISRDMVTVSPWSNL